MHEAIEWARVHLEFRKLKDEMPTSKGLTANELDKIERHLLSLVEIKRVLKMVRYYGGFEAIQDTLRTAIQAKQPSLFDETVHRKSPNLDLTTP